MKLKEVLPITNILINKIREQKKNRLLIKSIQSKFYCSSCRGRGYISCNSCFNGCSTCNYHKSYPCPLCSGVGFNAYYTYF